MSSDFKVLEGEHPDLKHWHGNVGEAVAVDLAGPLVRGVTGIDIISWNVAIGAARLQQVVEKLKAGWFDGEIRRLNRPLVILVQEAFRADDSVPERALSKHTGGKHPRQQRDDIVEAAHALGMSLRYAPSMRNGAHRSDRGNAVLSNVAIAHARAFPLPHVRQRRIAVAAELQGLPWLTFVTAHLDTRGRTAGRSGRMVQASELGRHLDAEWGTDQTIVIGADLNSYLGAREPMFTSFRRAGFQRLSLVGRPRHTFHAPALRMLLDHVLMRDAGNSIAACKVMRLDETKDDRGRFIFGSDHHPLLARLEFAPIRRRIKRS